MGAGRGRSAEQILDGSVVTVLFALYLFTGVVSALVHTLVLITRWPKKATAIRATIAGGVLCTVSFIAYLMCLRA